MVEMTNYIADPLDEDTDELPAPPAKVVVTRLRRLTGRFGGLDSRWKNGRLLVTGRQGRNLLDVPDGSHLWWVTSLGRMSPKN
jgi:hypothetical protein